MAKGEVWNESPLLLKLVGFHVVQANLFVAVDDSVPVLSNAYRMLCSLRILGAQIDNDVATNNFAVKNGPVSIPVSVNTFNGKVDGSVSLWRGVTAAGAPSTDPNWADADFVEFTLAAVGNVTIPVADILALVPTVGPILKLLLNALPGQKVSFNLSHTDVKVPVHRDGTGKAVVPPGAVVPAWWP
jgi:hypothetical protein